MWNDLLFSLNTVLPLLLIMLAGFMARRLKILDDVGIRQANSAVFNIFLPLLLCLNVMDTKLGQELAWPALAYGMGAVIVSFIIMFKAAPRLCVQPESRGVLIQGVARSNYAIFGIPLIQMMYPQADTSVSALMVVAVVPLFNVLSTVALLRFNGKNEGAWAMVREVLTNPLILGTLTGLALWLLQWQFPPLLDKPLRALGSVATPLALFLLGASLDLHRLRAQGRLLWLGVGGRLIAVPLVFLTLAAVLQFRDVQLATLIAVFASPTAVSSYPMAQQLGGDADFAASQVALTTAFSGITVFVWVFVFKALGCLR